VTEATAVEIEEPLVHPKPKKNKRTKQKNKPKPQPPYAVIVHNDEEHTFPYVIELLKKVCGHPTAKAVQLTFQVHNQGKAIVWSGALEVAELKRDQIRGYGPDFYATKPVRFPLGVTIEQLPGD
jgi:ATP-dependent Clp protease adaptor protein ClpS